MSGAATTELANAARRRAGSETLPSSRSSMTARRAGPRTVVSVSMPRMASLVCTKRSISSRSPARPASASASRRWPRLPRCSPGAWGSLAAPLLRRPRHPWCRPAARRRPRRSGPVGLGIDLAPDDLLDHVHDDLAHAIGRFLDGALAGQCHLGLGAADDALELASPRAWASTRTASAVRLAWATISSAVCRASSSAA